MDERHLLGLASVLILGFVARWIAWRLHLPSILLLLVCGLIAGPGTGFLDPDALLGEALLPFVSLSVALILFEGGLSLNIRELREIGGVVRNLVTIGAAVTWVIGSAGAWLILELELPLAVLMGAVFVVTGPTVVIPLLQHVRPTMRIRNTIKWEGILNDPVGAILAVLVFEAILAGGFAGSENAGAEFFFSIMAGVAVGATAAAAMLLLLYFHWVPEVLDNAFSLAMVVGAFTVSNHVQPESGLVATTVMGVALANQNLCPVRHIVEFKENLRVLIISTLFILLAARLKADAISAVWGPSMAYLALLMFVARPAAVWISCLGSKLTRQERVFLTWMAPRGIVAAAVASIFSERLVENGQTEAGVLVPIAFLVIIGSVTVYGLAAYPIAKRLKLAEPSPQGILFVGAHSWARRIAKALKDQGFEVALVDSHRPNVAAAKLDGLPVYFGGILSERVLDNINLYGIGRLMALTSNEEANSLASVHFAALFGRKETYQLRPAGVDKRSRIATQHLQGRYVFAPEVTFDRLDKLFAEGAQIKTTPLSEKFDYKAFLARYGEKSIPLFVVSDDESPTLEVSVAAHPLKPRAGQTLIALVPAEPKPPVA